jgi:hypothetical protein
MYKRNNEGIHIINIAKTWEKLMVAARIIAAIPNPSDIFVSISSNIYLSFRSLENRVLVLLVPVSAEQWDLLFHLDDTNQ